MIKSIIILTAITVLSTSDCEARKRSETYVDVYGVRRIQKTGKIYRDYKAINDFKRRNPKPVGGDYVVDHIIPLKRGGSDTPHNMQWQTVEDAREKDKWE